MNPPFNNTGLHSNLEQARRSTKRLKLLSDQYNNDEEDIEIDKKKDSGLINKIGMVFASNYEKLRTMDQDLKHRYDSIHQLTCQFEMYIAVIQHEANNFDEMNSDLYEQMIKTDVIELIKFISQQQYKDVETTIGSIQNIYDTLKQNVKNGEAFDQIITPAQNLFEKLDH